MYGNLPPETLSELLLYLNENEDFASLKLLGTVSREELSKAVQSLAGQLKKEGDTANQSLDWTQLKELKEPYRELLGSLSPRERELLLKGFLS
jgi:hypothetical protein